MPCLCCFCAVTCYVTFVLCVMQVLLVVDPALEEPTFESQDGVTPPMRKARSRHFKPRITLPQPHMHQAVSDVLDMLAGR